MIICARSKLGDAVLKEHIKHSVVLCLLQTKSLTSAMSLMNLGCHRIRAKLRQLFRYLGPEPQLNLNLSWDLLVSTNNLFLFLLQFLVHS